MTPEAMAGDIPVGERARTTFDFGFHVSPPFLFLHKVVIGSILSRLFGFFASLKLAVVLLLALGATLAAGTFIESLHGAKAAQQVVYHSPCFNLLLGLLGVNVAAAALDRLPWERRHIGFVLTHAGILLILLGSWMTHRFAVDGEVALSEGETGDRITLPEPLLQITFPHTDQNILLPIKPTPFRWEGRRPLRLEELGGLEANLLAYYPHAEAVEKVLPKTGGKPAAAVTLFNSFLRTGGWLIQGDSERDAVHLGPAVIRFATQEAVNDSSRENSKGRLTLRYKDQETVLEVSAALEKETAVPGTPYTLAIKRFLPHAVVHGGELLNQSEEPLNPACVLTLRGNGILEEHTVFARFPDFPTIHGLAPSETEIRIRYEFETGQAAGANELRILRDASGDLVYQVAKRGVFSPPQALEVGKPYKTGWMDLEFQVTAYHPEAEYQSTFEARPMPAQGKSPVPAALIEFNRGKDFRRIWFTRGKHEVFFLGGMPLRATYGHRSLPLDFDLKLKEFMIDYYPGTVRPASFKSNVILEDPAMGISRETVISMNKPLSHRGFKIYQSGYQLAEGEPDISVFQVGRDPGISVKYTGSVVMILGILTMFYMKRFSSSKPLYAEP